jgi:cyclomaltodextrinase / maltogenic alpha-amylase / neopullulanase
MNIKLGVYKHYKGNEYKVMGVANHSETLEEFVVYQALYGDKKIWIRPKIMFEENVKVAGKIQKRFEYIE